VNRLQSYVARWNWLMAWEVVCVLAEHSAVVRQQTFLHFETISSYHCFELCRAAVHVETALSCRLLESHLVFVCLL
jgi:hypothetical protein